MEERELERKLERLAEHWNLRMQEIDPLLVKDPRGVRRLRLPEPVPLEQRLVERRRDVRDEGAEHAEHERGLEEGAAVRDPA